MNCADIPIGAQDLREILYYCYFLKKIYSFKFVSIDSGQIFLSHHTLGLKKSGSQDGECQGPEKSYEAPCQAGLGLTPSFPSQSYPSCLALLLIYGIDQLSLTVTGFVLQNKIGKAGLMLTDWIVSSTQFKGCHKSKEMKLQFPPHVKW